MSAPSAVLMLAPEKIGITDYFPDPRVFLEVFYVPFLLTDGALTLFPPSESKLRSVMVPLSTHSVGKTNLSSFRGFAFCWSRFLDCASCSLSCY